jgi:hypothetical protein
MFGETENVIIMKIFENNDYYTFANGIEKFANAIKSS